jgi:hypothetical protein
MFTLVKFLSRRVSSPAVTSQQSKLSLPLFIILILSFSGGAFMNNMVMLLLAALTRSFASVGSTLFTHHCGSVRRQYRQGCHRVGDPPNVILGTTPGLPRISPRMVRSQWRGILDVADLYFTNRRA